MMTGSAERRSSLLGVAHRLGWGIGDQALSSLTNLALSVFVARSVTTREFGGFSIVFATYLIALGTSRAVTTEPLAVRYAATEGEVWRSGAASATGTALIVGFTMGIATALLGLVIGGRWTGPYLALSITLPGLLLQDSYRFAFIAAARGRLAFLNDLVWAVVLLMALLIVPRSVTWFVLAWGGAATVAGLVGSAQARLLPQPLRATAWWREHRDLIPHFLAMFITMMGAAQLTLYAAAIVAGLAAAGALRAAQVLLGPLNVLFLGVRLIGVPEGVRLLRRSALRLRKGMTVLSVSLSTCALGWGVAVSLLPGKVGSELLGSSWGPARRLLIPFTIMMASAAVQLGAVVGVRSLAAVKLGLRAQGIEACLTIAGGVGGAVLGGAVGAAYGLAIAYVLEAAEWWWFFNRAVDESRIRQVEGMDSIAQPPSIPLLGQDSL
jgi:hypothetical protein